MKIIQILSATLLSLAALVSCRSNDAKDTHEFACTCGEPDADFFCDLFVSIVT